MSIPFSILSSTHVPNSWHKSFKFFDKVLNIILELLKRWQRQQNSEKFDNHMESNFLIEKVIELDDKITNIDKNWGENHQFLVDENAIYDSNWTA